MVLAMGAAVPAQPTEAELSDLLHALTSTDFDAREQATTRLVGLGEPARAFLEKAREGLDLEGKLRIDAILARLSTADPTVERVAFEPTIVDIDIEEEPIALAARQLGDAGGVAVSFGRTGPGVKKPPGGEVPVSFKAKGISFFEALDRFCAITGCIYNTDYATGGFVLTPGYAGKIGPVRYDGPMRVLATSLSISRQTRFTDPPTINANLQIRINIEPRARVLGVIGPLEGVTAKDDLGNALTFRTYNGQRTMQAMGRQLQSFQSLSFEAPSPAARKLLQVRIPLDLVVPSSMLESEVRSLDVAPPEARGTGALGLKVDAVADTQPGFRSVTISFRPTIAEGKTELRVPPQHEEIKAYDLKGQVIPLPVNTIGRRRVGNREVRTLRLPDTPIGRIQVRALRTYEVIQRVVTFPELKLP